MRNLLLGIIFGLILASTIPSNAYDFVYTEYQNEVIYLLEQLVDNGDEISGQIDTLTDKL